MACAFLILLLVLFFLLSRRERILWIVTPELFLKAKGSARRPLVRPWRRVDIAGLRVVHRVATGGYVRTSLELELKSHDRQELVSGSVDYLRNLATVLRSALGVGPGSRDPQSDPDEPSWIYGDELEAPAQPLFAVARTPDEMVIQKPASGKGCMIVAALCMAILSLLAAGIFWLVTRLFALKPEDRRAVLGIVVLCLIWASLCFFAVLWDVNNSTDLRVKAGVLSVTRKTLFGTRRSSWTRQQISSVRPSFDFARSSSNEAALATILAGGKQRKIASGRPEEMRYLATLIRNELNVPATTADEKHSA